MPKRNVAFIKPEEPSFLKKMKEQIGYKEGPSVDDKREAIENYSDDSDDEEKEDERPQVVVIKEGDLTEAEADKAFKEESEKPADLSQKIVFKSKKAKLDKADDKPKAEQKKPRKAKDKQHSKLSFDAEDEED
ncbi:uncharacterized protein KIAA1143 homolog [Anopheles cruzii]|uniref:uncharacterized protein KIAA1143 homolog n=1 Tax=Anopheles cruzii TaxID=68878 RepID=UPI0022EC1F9B|nr:uncharacterized protein KIAA1143 homolog [Anopheles cruzii]XP_052861131.1 uncharacterized protein KIAA1143 homolog [Anopheles cruzii]XP_052871070.1 uncharacterized protein KIAA1143 homolog [Anopheles cruzii]